MFRKAKHAKKSPYRKHINILLCVLLVVSLVFAGTVLGKYIVEKTLDDKLNLTITGGAPSGTFTLKAGSDFNAAISPLFDSTAATKIQFGSWKDYGSANNLTWSAGTDVGVEDNTIKAFASGDTVYILSGGDMYANEDCSNMFEHYTYDMSWSPTATANIPHQRLTAIDGFEHVNTSNVKNMNNMFYYCSSITSLDLARLDTRNVESMSGMFYNCGITSFDGSDLDTSKVTDMSNMFRSSGLTSFDASDFDTSKVTNMSYMFSSCSSLTTLDLSSLDTGKVTNMSAMFYYSGNLTSLDVSTWDTSNVDNMMGIFTQCTKLENLDVSRWDTSSVTTFATAFFGCNALKVIDLTSWEVGNATDMTRMFASCEYVEVIDLRGFDVSKVTQMSYMFDSCRRLQTIYVDSDWNPALVTSANSVNMFTANYSTAAGTYLTGGEGTQYANSNPKDVTYARIDFGPDSDTPGYLTLKPENVTLTTGTEFNTKIKNLFNTDVTKLRFGNHLLLTKEIPELADLWAQSTIWVDVNDAGSIRVVTYGDTVYVISQENWEIYANADSSDMFSGGSSASALNNIGNYLTEIEGLDYVITDNVTDMSSMFASCRALTTLDVTSFETDAVTDMSNMFSGCSELTALNVAYFDTSLVVNMSNMFNGCSAVTTLDVSGLETGSVTNMSGMFANMSSLESLNLSKFDTSAATDMSAMFQGCTSLTALDLTSFNTDGVTTMTDMFRSSSKLKTIYVSAETWKTDTVTGSANMFLDCTAILGEQGTPYDAAKIDKEYARIDRVISEGVKGYLTGDPLMAILKTGPDVQDAFVSNLGSEDTILFTTYAELVKTDLALAKLWESSESFVDVGDIGVIRVFTSGNTIYVASKGSMEIFANPDSNHMLASAKPAGGMNNLWYSIRYLNGLNSINTSKVTSMLDMFEESNVSSLDITKWDTSNVTNMHGMFYGCNALGTLDVSNFDTSSVTAMAHMFGHTGLTTLDISSFDTSNVTDMSYMFHGCTSLTTIYVNDLWTTAKVIDSAYMFLECPVLVGGKGTTLAKVQGTGVTAENSYKATYARIDGGTAKPGYFTAVPVTLTTGSEFDAAINSLLTNTRTSIRFGAYNDVVGADTTLATAWANSTIYVDENKQGLVRAFANGSTVYIVSQGNLQIFANPDSSSMFGYDQYIEYIYGLEDVDTSKVENMYGMFNWCDELKSLDLSSWDTSKVTDMGLMFNNCRRIENIDVSNFDTHNVTNMAHMFNYCMYSLTELDISSFNTKNVTSMYQMFYYCQYLTTIYVGDGWTTENVTNGGQMFYNCKNLLGGECTPFDSAVIDKTYACADKAISQGVKGYLTDANAPGAVQLTEASKFRSTMASLLSDTVTNIRFGTYNDIAASDATLSVAWAMSTNYVDVDGKGYARAFVSGDTVYVLARTNSVLYAPEDSSNMFAHLTTLNNVHNVKTLNTSKVTNMSYMFDSCPYLESLDLSGWDTSNVTDMSYMFRCGYDSNGETFSYLESLNLSGWDTSKNKTFEGMFYGCYDLRELDLSSFETTWGIPTSDGSTMTYLYSIEKMFYECSGLGTIYVDPSRWTDSGVKGGAVFAYCYSLKGGNGSIWTAGNSGWEYARVDEPGSPGYFTDIAAKTGASALSLDDASAAEDEESDGTTAESGSKDTAAAESAADSTAEAILPVAQTKEESESETEPDADDPEAEEE